MTDTNAESVNASPSPAPAAPAVESPAPGQAPAIPVIVSSPAPAPVDGASAEPPKRKRGRPALTEDEKAARRAARAGTEPDKIRAERERLGSVTPRPAIAQPSPQGATAIGLDYGALGEQAADMFFFGGMVVFGEDWAPDTKAGEHVAVAGAFASFFRHKRIPEIDPTYGLALVLISYGAKRMQKPTFRERLSGMWAWVKSKLPS